MEQKAVSLAIVCGFLLGAALGAMAGVELTAGLLLSASGNRTYERLPTPSGMLLATLRRLLLFFRR
jgi:hypothetical protein